MVARLERGKCSSLDRQPDSPRMTDEIIGIHVSLRAEPYRENTVVRRSVEGRYISTKENLVDFGSRRELPEALLTNELWRTVVVKITLVADWAEVYELNSYRYP